MSIASLWRSWWEQSFGRGAIILFVTSGFSYGLGLLRDRVLAGTFGASRVMDAYQAAFIIPDTIFNVFVAAALSAAFIPVFTDLRTQRKGKQAAQLAGVLLTGGLIILIIIGLLSFVLAGPLSRLVAPGFSPTDQRTLVGLTRIMLLSPLIFLISNLFGGMLVSTKRFLFYGLSPALYNVGIIVGAWLLAPLYGIYGVAIGTVIGALLHMAARVIDVKRAGLKLLPSLTLTPAVRKVIKLMLPRIVGLAALQIQLWAFVAIASTLGEGSITIYSLARNFQSFPVSLIGIALATSLFPLLAESASKRDRANYQRQLRRGLLTVLAFVVPAAAAIYVLRVPIISFFLGTGRFDAEAIALTAAVLGVYTLSIPVESLVHMLARGFYALHNTVIPVSISIIAMMTSVAGAIWLAQVIGIAGIPAGFAAGTTVQAVLLYVFLQFKIRKTFVRQPG